MTFDLKLFYKVTFCISLIGLIVKFAQYIQRFFNQIQGVASADNILQEGDILVLFGSNSDLQSFLKLKMR